MARIRTCRPHRRAVALSEIELDAMQRLGRDLDLNDSQILRLGLKQLAQDLQAMSPDAELVAE